MLTEEWEKGIFNDWMKGEGIPIYEGLYGIEDITELPRRPWARMGGQGTFIELEPTRKVGKMLYVAEIPPGGALEPEKHLYDELIYIVRGRGLSEVWYQGESQRSFEWGEASLFCMPPNVWHRLVNGGQEPVLLFAQTNAPVVMNAFRSIDFVFNNDYKFTDRYAGEADYFTPGTKRTTGDWYTNFVPDVRTCLLDDTSGLGLNRGNYWIMSSGPGGGPGGDSPTGRYSMAHFHVGGALLIKLKGEGYCLMWHRRYGIHPYQDGYGDKVRKVNWKANSIYSPDSGEFHHHFTTKGPAQGFRLVVGGSHFAWPRSRGEEHINVQDYRKSIREGGPVIRHEDEDPQIRRDFEEACAQKGVQCTMPPVVYRTDPFELPYERD